MVPSPGWVWLLGIPIGMLAAAILVANNLRDIDTDARVGKRTLAVLLGRARTQASLSSPHLGRHRHDNPSGGRPGDSANDADRDTFPR